MGAPAQDGIGPLSSRRFAVLRHELAPGDVHRDLLVAGAPEGKLFAWKLAGPLPESPGESVAAERNFDHRELYLEYEGPVSGGRGTVSREHGGLLEDVSGEPTHPGYAFACPQGTFELSGGESLVLRRLA